MNSRFSLLATFICTFMSCSKDNITFEINEDAIEILERERAAWNAQDYENYQFAYCQDGGYVCEVYGALTVKISVSENKEPQFIEKSPKFPEDKITLKSVSDIFDMLNDRIDAFLWQMEIIKAIKTGMKIPDGEDNPFNLSSDNVRHIKSMHLIIKYNTQYHYPEEVIERTDYNVSMDGDYGGFSLKITEFTPAQNEH